MFESEGAQCSDVDQSRTLHAGEAFSSQAGSGRSGDLACWMNAHRTHHLRYLRSRLPSFEDAEDALQDATVKLLRQSDFYHHAECPDAWVRTTLRNIVIDRYRRAASRRRLAESYSIEPPENSESEDDDRLTPIACLTATLPSLKYEYRSLLQQVYFGDVSLNDVARNEHLTANNVAVRLHRARNALRQKMQHQCQTCPLEDCWARQLSNADASS